MMNVDQLSPQMKGAKTRLLNQLEKRLKIAALEMEGRSKQIAFSNFNNQTGRLRQSIAGRFAVVDGKPTAILQAGGQFGGQELSYARYIEFGTRYIKPRRFLGRSVEKQQEQIRPKLQDLLRTVLIKGE
jgi:hypothetical protein